MNRTGKITLFMNNTRTYQLDHQFIVHLYEFYLFTFFFFVFLFSYIFVPVIWWTTDCGKLRSARLLSLPSKLLIIFAKEFLTSFLRVFITSWPVPYCWYFDFFFIIKEYKLIFFLYWKLVNKIEEFPPIHEAV